MLSRNLFFYLIILIFTPNISLSEKLYTHYNYDQIIEAFEELSKTCSHYIKITTSQARYNLDSFNNCGNKPCMNLIVFLTDFDSYTLDRPSYYISSSIHGDEVIGSSSLVEFAKYFCDSYEYKKNSLFHNILKTKLIIMTPMTNAYGYYHKKREEKIFIKSSNKYESVDPNRDFPYYNNKNEVFNCMRTLSARTINEIFNEFIISGAITFHGGDNVLGYPWGNYLHIMRQNNKQMSTETPDFKAFDSIGKIMVKFSSSEKNENNSIKKYGIGDMTQTVYPLNGALEDWAYGGWEKYEVNKNNNINPIKTCKPDSFNSNYNMLWDLNKDENYYDYKLRCLIYLAEASYNKMPNEKDYGINDFDIKGNTRDVFDFYKTTDFFGHIPRNMRLIYSAVDLISASIYLDINNIQKISDESINTMQYTIPFIFMGCLTLRKYSIYKIPFDHLTKDLLQKQFFENKLNSSSLIYEYNDSNSIKCYYLNNSNYNFTIKFTENKNDTKRNLDKNDDPLHHFVRPGGDYDYLGNVAGVKVNNLNNKKGNMYIISGEAPDEDWGLQNKPDPNVKPQSHIVRSKINKNYFVDNGNYTLKSNYFFYSYPIIILDDNDINNNIKIVDDIDSLFYEDEFNIMKLIINSNNKDIDINSQIRFNKVNNGNSLLTSDNIFDVDLKIDIEINKKSNLIIKENNDIDIYSSLLLREGIINIDCNHNINNKNYITIRCTILKEKQGNYIRQKLYNAIIGFELKQVNKTFLDFFGTFSFDGDNKGKFYDNNKMICSNNFPHFIQNKNENNHFYDDLFYELDIYKISNTKLKVKFVITINNNKYKNYHYLILFPFCKETFFFDEKNNKERDIDISEISDGKIVGKMIYLIPVEKKVYEEIEKSKMKLENIYNDAISTTLELNKISKRSYLYESFPCSIISNNSFDDKILIEYFSKFNTKISFIDRIVNMNIYNTLGLVGTIILAIIIISTITTIIYKYNSKYHKYIEEPVEISNSSNS